MFPLVSKGSRNISYGSSVSHDTDSVRVRQPEVGRSIGIEVGKSNGVLKLRAADFIGHSRVDLFNLGGDCFEVRHAVGLTVGVAVHEGASLYELVSCSRTQRPLRAW